MSAVLICKHKPNSNSLTTLQPKINWGCLCSVYAVQPLLAKFQCIREVEETWLLLYPGLDRRISQSTQGNNSLPSAEDPLTLLGRLRDAWHHRLQAAETSWQTLDMVLTLRCVLLKMVVCLIPGQSCQPLAERLLLEHLLHHAELGRAAGRFQGAFLASSVLKSKDVFLAELENAKTHWARAESVLALRVLKFVVITKKFVNQWLSWTNLYFTVCFILFCSSFPP